MQQMIELYEMVAMNEDALRDTDRRAIQQARLALGMFERAMQGFQAQFFQNGTDRHTSRSVRLPGDQCFRNSVTGSAGRSPHRSHRSR